MDWVFNKIKDRKRRIDLRRKFLSFLKLIKFMLALADIVSDIYYLSTASFYNDIVYFLAITSLCALPTVLYLIGFLTLYKESKRSLSLSRKLIGLIFWIFIGPILCCIYPLIIFLEIFLPVGYRNLGKFLSLEYFYEALPQLCIQVLNNNISKSWTTSAIVSCTISSLSITLGLFQLSRVKFNQEYISLLKQIEKLAITNVQKNHDHSKNNTLKEDPNSFCVKDKILDSIGISIVDEDIKKNEKENCKSTDSNIPEEFIRLKFFEIFDINELALNMNYDLIIDSNYSENDHKEIEILLKQEFNNYANSLRSETNNFNWRCKPLGFYVLTKMIIVLMMLIINIAYISIADFKYEYIRYLLIFLMGWYYKYSISYIQKLEKQMTFRHLPILRVFINSDYYNLVYLLYNIKPKILRPLKNEFINFPYFWVFFISFQIWNYNDARDYAGLHVAAILFSLLYFFMAIFRIILLCLKRSRDFEYY